MHAFTSFVVLGAGCAFAYWLSEYISWLSFPVATLLGGVILANIQKPTPIHPWLSKFERLALAFGIVFLGAGLELHSLTQLGISAVLQIIAIVIATLAISVLLSFLPGISASLAILTGIGTAVCGSAAILCCSKIAGSDRKDTSLAVAVTNLLGALAMFAIPAACILTNTREIDTAWWLGGGLQAVGQVAGASSWFSQDTAELAMLIKMLRVAMLVPVAIFVAGATSLQGHATQRLALHNILPWYLYGFLGCFALFTLFPVTLAPYKPLFELSSRLCFGAAMAVLGYGIRFSDIRRAGPKALILGILLLAVQLVGVWIASR